MAKAIRREEDCIGFFNAERGRNEFFGDWGLMATLVAEGAYPTAT